MTDDFTHMTHDADRTPILWTDGAVSSLPIRTKTGRPVEDTRLLP